MSVAAADHDPKPQPPVAPEAIDCCGAGCVPCVYDTYETALERYREALAAWQARHPEASG
ncbi:MAG TPA: oxidoreductase-like domain-containing protein [Dyella sp.]|nr:oxidoreductase-like domain-containing protein [Dyella sp.]